MSYIIVDCLLITTILIASELRFVSNKGTDIFSPRKPTCRCRVGGPKELHQVDAKEAKNHGSLRKQLFGHGQATVSGEGALAWLLHPLYGYNQITVSYRRQNTPLNKKMMNIRCAIVAHFGRRLKTSKSESPTWDFMH